MSMPTARNAADCRRARQRTRIAQPSTVRADTRIPLDVTVEDFSPIGFRISSAVPIVADTLISIGLAGAGQARAKVTWRKDESHGCIFDPPLTPAQSAATFSHSTGDHAIISFVPGTTEPPTAAPANARPLGIWTRLILAALASGLGWMILATLLRSLPLS